MSFALYVRTLVPWLLPGDSGEFQVLADQVGIAHTTGYPVYMLLGKLFITLVPVADVAYRVNLFSAFMAAVAVALTYLAGRLAARSRWGGVFAALILAVSFTFWSQALIAEVYSAGAAFLAAVLVGLLAWERTGKRAPLFAAGLLGGLGLGAHASVGVFAPAAIVFLASAPASRWRTLWKPALLGTAAGLALYLLAFLIVDLNAPPANIFNAAYGPARSAWGLSEADIANPITRIIFVAAGRQWRTALYPDPVGAVKKVGDYVAKLPREFSLLTLILAAAGFLVLIRRDWRLAVLFGLGLLSFWLFYFNYHVGDIYVFYIPGYLLLARAGGRRPWRCRSLPGRASTRRDGVSPARGAGRADHHRRSAGAFAAPAGRGEGGGALPRRTGIPRELRDARPADGSGQHRQGAGSGRDRVHRLEPALSVLLRGAH